MQDTVELVEHTLKVGGRNTRTAIGYAQDNLLILNIRAHVDGRLRWRVADGVLDQIGQDLVDLHIIQFNQQQIIGEVSEDGTSLQQGLQASQHIMDECLK